LLHNVLDAEVDNPPSLPETALLPPVLSFLSAFKSYLDIVVNCTRKTELRSWETLFSYLPPVLSLFEQSLAQNKWNTAAGYLLVLYAFEQDPKDKEFQVHEFARLLRLAAQDGAWEICMEVSRFLLGIDASGETLSTALAEAGLSRGTRNGVSPQLASVDDVVAQHSIEDVAASAGRVGSRGSGSGLSSEATSRAASVSSPAVGLDYFSLQWRKDRQP
jgi:hypothetical protein